MQLYYAPASSYSQRVLITMREKKANLTLHEVNLFQPESREEYMQINHFAKIPTLITDSR